MDTTLERWKLADSGPNDTILAYERPQLVRLDDNIVGAAFPLMKLIPARHIIQSALEAGEVDSGTTVVESTSGTFGLGLALVCARYGIPLRLVSDPVLDPYTRARLSDLDVQVDVISEPDHNGGFQQPRLDRLAQLRRKLGKTFWPRQYSNPTNPQAYHSLAALLVEEIGPFDCLVGPVGSGGSMCGTTSYLRAVLPRLRAIAVDTQHSVLFGQKDAPRLLRGLGNSVLPENLDHTVFDDVHWVSHELAFRATRELHRRHTAFMGPTSGAAHHVARWYAAEHPEQQVVVLLPDEGHRYTTTVYDDTWLRERCGDHPVQVNEPRTVVAPREAEQSPWAKMSWRRRSLNLNAEMTAKG